MVELWRRVPGMENYEVSNGGRVRSVRNRRPRKLGTAPNGYAVVTLAYRHLGRRSKTFSVHTLVARTFLGERPDGHDVNHIDGNKINNAVTNLEYVTRSENQKHAVRMGLSTVRRGEACPTSKLTRGQVSEIRDLAGTVRQREVAQMFGISQSQVSRIQSRKRWTQ